MEPPLLALMVAHTCWSRPSLLSNHFTTNVSTLLFVSGALVFPLVMIHPDLMTEGEDWNVDGPVNHKFDLLAQHFLHHDRMKQRPHY